MKIKRIQMPKPIRFSEFMDNNDLTLLIIDSITRHGAERCTMHILDKHGQKARMLSDGSVFSSMITSMGATEIEVLQKLEDYISGKTIYFECRSMPVPVLRSY